MSLGRTSPSVIHGAPPGNFEGGEREVQRKKEREREMYTEREGGEGRVVLLFSK